MKFISAQDVLEGLRRPDIEEAVTWLYEHFFEDMLIHVSANGGDRSDGADIFQEAILILVDKVRTGQFREESNLKTFLTGIVRNLWLQELRSRSRRNAREEKYMAQQPVEESGPDLLKKSGRTTLHRLLTDLGETCRKILTGFYYEEKSMKEMLNEFEYDNEQVLRNRKSKCMKKLKEMIASDSEMMANLKSTLLYE